LGQLIHNNQVTNYLESLGITILDKIPDKIEGICIIRTHGAEPETISKLEKKGCRVVDLTCPDVKRVQNKAIDLAKEGYIVVIIGKPDHPEVIAIKAHADLYSKRKSIVIFNKDEAQNYLDEIKEYSKIGVVVQTTQLIENLNEILSILTEGSKELKIHNTICAATFERQKAAKALAGEVDLMVVVGSKSSANTTHLTEILKPIKSTIHIEDKENLIQYREIIKSAKKIGLTAGASTPDFVIDEVIKKIGELDS
jgi:4-hydroxy-3-methylbut-2-enyl diphosphate reductase